MGEIYSIAKRVLIWLGVADGSEPATFDLLRTVEPMLDWDEEATKPYGDVLADTLRENDHDAFKDLKRKSWFRRMWCLQEVVLAQDAIVICGGSTIPWSVLLFGVNLITESEKSKGEYGYGSQFRSIISSLIGARELLCTPSNAETTTLERHPLHESYSRNHMGKFLPVTTLLDIALRREATEPKDRVFGLHAILRKLGVPLNRLPLPDYNKELVGIYCEAARVAIEEDNCLWILNLINGIEQRDEDWPSWVPTWVTKFHPAPLEVNPFKAAGTSDPKYSFSHNGRRLTVRGKVVDRVMLKAEQSTWLGRVPNWETSQMAHIEEEVNMMKACHEWMILFTTGKVMAQMTGVNQYGDDYDHNVAFIRAVLQDFTIVDDHLNKLHDLIHGFYSWQRYLSATNPDSSLPIALLRRTLPPPHYDISTLPEPIQQCLMTDEWTIHRAIQQDKKAALFHTQASVGTRAKSFFITERAFYGTATAAIERGDRIVLVAGLRVPLVTRRVDERDDHFRVIGPAFVTGMMEGELWDESEEDLNDLTFV
ncbi:heterokaryon incompatibility protein cpaM [Curvularia clavata]|uniref:Heterokaryon incompatibility protein cpaM n=1 Tax=Curvularia clavata TaxID=95742 RepID=A0A9Q8Z2S1_CURCL|nr:heterokaryon incompatibility protein cpaM [Curvularia clavata]